MDPGLCGFIREEGNPFWKVTWDHWANKCLIATADSIEKFTLERTRQPIVALAYFFTQHERHLLAKHHDEEDAKRAMLDTCGNVSDLVKKISKCAQESRQQLLRTSIRR